MAVYRRNKVLAALLEIVNRKLTQSAKESVEMKKEIDRNAEEIKGGCCETVIHLKLQFIIAYYQSDKHKKWMRAEVKSDDNDLVTK